MQLAIFALLLLPKPAPAQQFPTRSESQGWIIARLGGTPTEIGQQYGAILKDEIEDAVAVTAAKCLTFSQKNWEWYRNTSQELFWDKLEPEYQEEIKGIAKGAQSLGSKLDYLDILALNAHVEISDYYVPLLGKGPGDRVVSRAPLACSAFLATGSYTKSGGVVAAQSLWWEHVQGSRWRLILEIHPKKGNAIVMDSMPGLIESASDWAQNSAGLLLTETTISGFVGFDKGGTPEFMRMRKAIQYGNNVKQMCYFLQTGNNGGYANSWLMADAKSGEIARFELGLKNVNFESTKDGYFSGSNYPADDKLMTEECPDYNRKSSGGCEERRERWKVLIESTKGEIDAEMAKTFMADSQNLQGESRPFDGDTISGNSLNVKITDSQLLKKFSFWARLGHSDGRIVKVPPLEQSPELRPFAHDVPGHPYTLFEPSKG